MSFGIGFGAFAQGLSGGLQQGISLGKAFKGIKADNAKQKAIEDAKGEYDKTVSDTVTQQAGQADPSQPFDTEAATAQAKQKIGSFTDFLYKQKMPQIIDSMVANGDIQGAETMRKWSEDTKERKFMDSFGKTLGNWAVGQSSGDYEPFAKSAVDLLNNGDYGMTATGYELVKDKDGKATGLTFNLKQGDKEIKHTFNSIDDAAQFLSAQGSPANRVKQWQASQDAAQKLKAETTKERIKASIGIGKEVAVENVKQGNRVALEDRKTENDLWKNAASASSQDPKVRAAASTKAQILREAGYGDDQINKWMPALLGIREETRQAMSGDDLVKFAMETLSKTDEAYMEADNGTKQKMINDFITAFRTTAKGASTPQQAPGIPTPQQQAPLPRY